jgi:hypothetical protein
MEFNILTYQDITGLYVKKCNGPVCVIREYGNKNNQSAK